MAETIVKTKSQICADWLLFNRNKINLRYFSACTLISQPTLKRLLEGKTEITETKAEGLLALIGTMNLSNVPDKVDRKGPFPFVEVSKFELVQEPEEGVYGEL